MRYVIAGTQTHRHSHAQFRGERKVEESWSQHRGAKTVHGRSVFFFFFREKKNIHITLEVSSFKETFRPIPNVTARQSVAVL